MPGCFESPQAEPARAHRSGADQCCEPGRKQAFRRRPLCYARGCAGAMTRPRHRCNGVAMASQALDRNLAFELARVTEAAAMAAARLQGRGDKNAADHAAVEAMRHTLAGVDMDGVVVIGEGEKDKAPMLYIGEEIGNGMPPRVDIAVDPIDG